jgi:hypothetical protein
VSCVVVLCMLWWCVCRGVVHVTLFYIVWRGVCSVVLRCLVLFLEVDTKKGVTAAV